MAIPTDALPRYITQANLQRARDVELLILDVDGVLTDGRLYYGQDGVELKAFHAQDGSAMKRLLAAGVRIAIISGRHSAAVHRRAAELGVTHVHTGVEDKTKTLARLDGSDTTDAIAVAGDDLADLPLFTRAGLRFAVPGAHPTVKARADHVTSRPGGGGAVQEICDILLIAKGEWPLAEP